MLSLPDRLRTACEGDGIVIMAGAGISAAPPTRLPGWFDLNRMIVEALGRRVEAYLGRPDYTRELREALAARRNADAFPPDYQAQILEETCGERYFQALQCLDVETRNSGHNAIASMARHGVVRAIVTTNFDRLIERALDDAGVGYSVAYEPESYAACLRDPDGTLPVVKVHGTVQDHLSMIDTLKQRLLGRNRDLLTIVERLLARLHWLFAGFSAADLESEENYLGLTGAAAASQGITYLQWPGNPELRPGARLLLEAYGEKGAAVAAEIAGVAEAICGKLPDGLPVEGRPVQEVLQDWADSLSPSGAVNCMAGLLEAAGETRAAFDLLHRFWKDVHPRDREGEDFDLYRYLHGRLGIGRGFLSMAQLDSTRVEESLQNLLRRAAKGDARAAMWSALPYLWAGRADEAKRNMMGAAALSQEVPPSAEEMADLALVASEVAFFTGDHAGWFINAWAPTAQRAREAGDLPRQARLAARAQLFYAEFVPDQFEAFRASDAMGCLQQAQRLNDPDVEGFLFLAHGRWMTRTTQGAQAQGHLNAGIDCFKSSGRAPWRLFAIIQYAKALMDAGYLDLAGQQLDGIHDFVDEQYPLLLVWLFEAGGQRFLMTGEAQRAKERFTVARDLAAAYGMPRRAEALGSYLEIVDGGQ